jgi:hypothetical protein
VEKLLSSGWSDLSREMGPGNAMGALRVLYIGRGNEVRGRGRKSGGPSQKGEGGETLGCHLTRGMEEAHAVLSLPLPSSTGGHPMVAHDVVAPAGAMAAWELFD